jgi:hypothetical protein
MLARTKSDLFLWAGIVLLTVLFLVLRMQYQGGGRPFFGDNDDAMRMVEVRDFLNSQNWFDHTQYRNNTPFGADMHWSRLVDLPIAIIVLLARPFAGPSAEIVAGYVWPMLLLAIFTWLNGRLALRLVGPQGLLPGMLLLAFSVITLGEFSFGRVDHHSVQIILTQLAVIGAIDCLARPRAAILAGLAIATALAIATESLPVIIAAILVFGVMFVASPNHHMAVRNFGFAFGLGALVHLGLALPPSLWFVPACDANSIVYTTAALGAGLGLAGLTLLPLANRGWPLRLALGALVGGAVLAGVVALFPNCLAGPYAALDPWLAKHWLAYITEAKPLLTILFEQPGFIVAATIPAVIGLAAALWATWNASGSARAAWLIVLTFLITVLIVGFIQVRGMRLTIALLAPAGAYLVVTARARYLRRPAPGTIIGLMTAWLGMAGLVWAGLVSVALDAMPAIAAGTSASSAERSACLLPGAYADLAGLPPERIMTPSDLGAYMLLYTPHSVVSAPYHRNNQGLLDTFHFFNGPIEQARTILEQRGIHLVVTCDAMPEMIGEPDAPADSFVHLAQRGALPDWLDNVSTTGPLNVYQVKPASP